MEFKRYLVEIENHVAQVKINRPNKANALDRTGWDELQLVFESLDSDPDVRVIVLSGEGKRFCAGADQQFLMQGVMYLNDDSPGHAREQLHQDILRLQGNINAIEKCRKPVLAAIHGACVGGAVDIITACDSRYMSEDAFISIAEIDLGIVADLGTLQRLPKVMPQGIVRELAFTGRRMGAAEAKEFGLVNKVYPDKETMMVDVMAIAQKIASNSPIAVRGIKQVLNHSRDHSVGEGLQFVANWNAAMLLNQDLSEAFSAMMERREANYRDSVVLARN
jgi:enoyl-CoA hydratase